MRKDNIKDINKANRAQDTFAELSDFIVNSEHYAQLPNLAVYTEYDSQPLDKLADKLNDEGRIDELISMSENFDAEASGRRAVNILKQREQKKRIKKLYIATSAIAAAVLFISFLVWTADVKPVTNELQLTQVNDVLVPTVELDNGDVEAVDVLSENSTFTASVDTDNKVLYYNKDNNKTDVKLEEQFNRLIVPVKYIYGVTLDDGTKVTLNAGSVLRYPVHFIGDERVVELTGEAYFKVTKSSKPFIVRSHNASVKVYGTEFNVDSYTGGCIKVALVDGSVGVTLSHSENKEETKIKPNELFTYSCESDKFSVTHANCIDYAGWMSTDFNYQNVPLKNLILDIEKWYGIKCAYSEAIGNSKITINIVKPENVIDLMGILENTLKDIKIINEGEGGFTII